jgi:CRISPR-associated protein Csm4
LKLYEITLNALSGFGSAIKGDTLFGCFCWQAVNDSSILKGGAETHFKNYTEKPFIVFSSAFPKLAEPSQYALKKPDLPAFMLFGDEAADCHEQQRQAKTRKEKRWLPVNAGKVPPFINVGRCADADMLTHSELSDRIARNVPAQIQGQRQQKGEQFIKTLIQPHNTICRLTNSTGTGMFAPYVHSNQFYYPETELVIFVLTVDRKGVPNSQSGRWSQHKIP